MSWQPIETAPLGKRVLILFKPSGHVEDAVFHDDGDGPYHVLFDGEMLNDEPSHWMPLPAPPTE